jgi:hypothetical protein
VLHVLDAPVVTQTVVASLHVLPGQHGSPSSPHDSQMPPVRHTCSMPTSPHWEPTPTHVVGVLWVSQQPSVHWSPLQHAWPVPPQGAHDDPVQTEFPPEHSSPAKTQVCPAGSQQPPLQGVPSVQHGPPL